ncbi:hypothetical protein BDF22DRAFT_695154 [Syncephalis plumigaleata]|nr:hypothetical protein BDF22DRAFT_695154 [Syncephalis plumigaleata]
MTPHVSAYNLDWQKDASTLWGIPLNPTGEMYTTEFIMETINDLGITRARLLGILLQICCNTIMMFMFANNFRISLNVVKCMPHFISGWCCLISASLGISWGLSVIAFAFDVFNCRIIIWFFALLILLSSLCNSAIVLQKVYLVFVKSKLVLVMGIILVLPQIVLLPLSLRLSYVTMDIQGGCGAKFHYLMPIYWFATTIPINLLFSATFSVIAYKQYKKYGSDAWRRLTRKGIQTMCLVVACNISCATCIVIQVAGDFSEMFFIVDWWVMPCVHALSTDLFSFTPIRLVTSTVLSIHCNAGGKRTFRSSHQGDARSTIQTMTKDNDIVELTQAEIYSEIGSKWH